MLQKRAAGILSFRGRQPIRADQFDDIRIRADLIVGARNGGANFSVRQKLTHVAFADEERFERVTDGTSPEKIVARSSPHGIWQSTSIGVSEISSPNF